MGDKKFNINKIINVLRAEKRGERSRKQIEDILYKIYYKESKIIAIYHIGQKIYFKSIEFIIIFYRRKPHNLLFTIHNI